MSTQVRKVLCLQRGGEAGGHGGEGASAGPTEEMEPGVMRLQWRVTPRLVAWPPGRWSHLLRGARQREDKINVGFFPSVSLWALFSWLSQRRWGLG